MRRSVPSGVIVLAIALAVLVGRASGAVTATCTNDQLVPNVAELLVSQGAPGYAKLARGKETIVRAYLRNPTGCTLSNKQSITPVSATLDVGGGATGPQLTNYQPLSGKLGVAQQIYSTSDPIFVVPASYLAPAGNTSSFNATFTLGLTYTRTGSTSSFTNATAAAATVTVDQKTNALRVLVVPMGDPTSTTTQWSSAAETTLQNIMTDTVRALPLPSGATPALTEPPPTSGARYRVSGDLLDVKSLGLYKTSGNPSATKFCANAANWNTSQVSSGTYAGHTLKGDLQERLDNYNLYNDPPADVVLGVIDGAIAWKSADGLICDDGRAATPDPTARTPGEAGWVRVDTGTYSTPLQMELLHTLGIVDPALFPSFHGSEVEADGGTSKGYNVLQRKVIATVTGTLGFNDHSIMNYNTTNIPYRRDNTLSVPRDWMDALCNLGGVESAGTFASCTISSAIGTDSGVAAGNPMYHIVGHISGGVVTVTDANTAAGDGEFGVGPASSPLHLLLCVGPCATSGSTRDVPLALSGQAPIDDDHTGPDGSTIPDQFSALVSLDSYTCAQLKHGVTVVFDACASDLAPNVVSTEVDSGTVLEDITLPHGNGRAVAFDGDNLLYTTLVGAESGADNRTIYKFTTDGEAVGTVNADIELGALAFNPQDPIDHLYGGNYTATGEIYDISTQEVDGVAPRTTLFAYGDDDETENPICPFSSEGFDLRKYIDGLERLPDGNLAVGGDRCTRVDIMTTAGVILSSFTVPPGEDRSGITTDGGDGLWLALHATAGGGPATRLVRSDLQGNIDHSISLDRFLEDLAFDSTTFAPSCAVWGNTIDSPAHVIAFAVPCSGSSVHTVNVSTTNTDFVTLFAACGTQAQATDPEVEKFSLGTYVPDASGQTITPFTDDRYCENATIIAEASNGWTSTGLSDAQATADVDPPSQGPTVNIAAPLNGTRYRRNEQIHFEGSAFDSKDGEIVSTLKWYDNGTLIADGTGKTSFDLKVASDAVLGDHVIRLEATDADVPVGNVGFTTVTITIRPAVCPSTSKCP